MPTPTLPGDGCAWMGWVYKLINRWVRGRMEWVDGLSGWTDGFRRRLRKAIVYQV